MQMQIQRFLNNGPSEETEFCEPPFCVSCSSRISSAFQVASGRILVRSNLPYTQQSRGIRDLSSTFATFSPGNPKSNCRTVPLYCF